MERTAHPGTSCYKTCEVVEYPAASAGREELEVAGTAVVAAAAVVAVLAAVVAVALPEVECAYTNAVVGQSLVGQEDLGWDQVALDPAFAFGFDVGLGSVVG